MKITKELVTKIESLIGGGLSVGLGDPNGMMCVEAAVCLALGLPHGDEPPCVGRAVRIFKVNLNDSEWSSPLARANGLRKIAIAQLGSNSLDQVEFTRRISEKTIQIIIPTLFREVFKDDEACLKAADLCEMGDGSAVVRAATDAYYTSASAAYAALDAARSASAAYAALDAARSASAAYAALDAAREANNYTSYDVAMTASDKYLILSAELCYQVLDEMGSPGAVWMRENNWVSKGDSKS